MIITVPFYYDARIILKRKRNAKSFMIRSQVDVKVEEVSGEEAPVALRWKPYFSRDPRGFQEMRWWDDCLWSPVYYKVAREPDRHIRVEDLLEKVAAGHSYANPLFVGYDWKFRDAQDILDLEVREVTESERDKVVSAIESCASGILIVDGMVWERTSEPVYVVHRSLHDEAFIGTELADRMHSVLPEFVYRADRWDDAVAAAAKAGGRALPDADARMEILIPEVLRHDDETPAIMSVADRAKERMASHLADADRRVMLAYADLRDALDVGSPVEPDLLAALEEAAEAVEDMEYLGSMAEDIRRAVEKWRMRPISLDDVEPTESIEIHGKT